LILEWSLDLGGGDDTRFNHGDGPGWLAHLTPLRDELLRGDLRPLYLGWLSRLHAEELHDDELEPMGPADRDGASQRRTVAQIKAGRGR
jgi:hypothetical protein